MHQLIALTLIEKQAIKQGTEIEGYYKGVDLSGQPIARVRGVFLINTARRMKTGDLFFECIDTCDGSKRKIFCEDITKIDGMEPDRAANVWGFALEDDTIVMLKKRGRKSKAESAEDDDDEDELDAAA